MVKEGKSAAKGLEEAKTGAREILQPAQGTIASRSKVGNTYLKVRSQGEVKNRSGKNWLKLGLGNSAKEDHTNES